MYIYTNNIICVSIASNDTSDAWGKVPGDAGESIIYIYIYMYTYIYIYIYIYILCIHIYVNNIRQTRRRRTRQTKPMSMESLRN